MHYKWTLHFRTSKQVKHLWFAKLRIFLRIFFNRKKIRKIRILDLSVIRYGNVKLIDSTPVRTWIWPIWLSLVLPAVFTLVNIGSLCWSSTFTAGNRKMSNGSRFDLLQPQQLQLRKHELGSSTGQFPSPHPITEVFALAHGFTKAIADV